MGTFSKSLAPSICLSYLVLPPKLMLRWLAPHGMMHTQVPWYTQRILAEFMREDLWYAHLRRLQTIYRRKHDALVDALNRHMGDRVDCLQQDVGLHVLVRTKDPRSAEELVALAAANGVRVYPTAHTWVEGAPTEWDYVLVGYSAIPLEAIDEGVRHLAEAWFA
jgi:GntR family transcriptional regulator/MocR family aminotransferase